MPSERIEPLFNTAPDACRECGHTRWHHSPLVGCMRPGCDCKRSPEQTTHA